MRLVRQNKGIPIDWCGQIAGLIFLGKNKAFSVPRCVWCGKSTVLNLFGRFCRLDLGIFASEIVTCGNPGVTS